MTGEKNYSPTTRMNLELRHVEASNLFILSTILDVDKSWSRLVEELTKHDRPNSKTRFNLCLSLNNINLIKQQANCGRSPSLALLNYWSITGRRRPTIKTLLTYLNLCQLKRAADYVCQSLLKEELGGYSHPTELVAPQPMLRIQSFQYGIDKIFKFDNLSEIVEGLNPKQIKSSFRSLYDRTDGFSERFKIGEGRFSFVYKTNSNETLAVKLLKSACNKNYLINEINLMGKIKHQNILELTGIAWELEGYICLVYPYLQNGSLLDCLDLGVATRSMDYLTWFERLRITKEIAAGISFLHNYQEGPIVHRDIKSANIFLGTDLEPKIGDFTLVRQLDRERTASGQFSQNIIGTSVYMPPEAFRGDISTKFDIFSFGVVLLEILTGLQPFNSEKNEDLLTHIGERLSDINDEYESGETRDIAIDAFVADILDKKAGNWNLENAKTLLKISMQATETKKSSRPDVSEILLQLDAVLI